MIKIAPRSLGCVGILALTRSVVATLTRRMTLVIKSNISPEPESYDEDFWRLTIVTPGEGASERMTCHERGR